MTWIDDRVGPVFSREQMVEAGLPVAELIWLTIGRPEQRFPAAQFDVVGGALVPRADVRELWGALAAAGLGPLSRWLWITSPKPELYGHTPLDCLGWWSREPALDDVVDSLVMSLLAA